MSGPTWTRFAGRARCAHAPRPCDPFNPIGPGLAESSLPQRCVWPVARWGKRLCSAPRGRGNPGNELCRISAAHCGADWSYHALMHSRGALGPCLASWCWQSCAAGMLASLLQFAGTLGWWPLWPSCAPLRRGSSSRLARSRLASFRRAYLCSPGAADHVMCNWYATCPDLTSVDQTLRLTRDSGVLSIAICLSNH